jgi:hypothetical protein
MKKSLFAILLCLLCGATIAEPKAQKVPKGLQPQIRHLTELLIDSYAEGRPNGTIVQMVKLRGDEELALAILEIQGEGGGNTYTQYFAVFDFDTNSFNKRSHFRLLDVIPIGGKGWRNITGETSLAFKRRLKIISRLAKRVSF